VQTFKEKAGRTEVTVNNW